MTETLGRMAPLTISGRQHPTITGEGYRPLDILILTSEAPPIVSGISTCIDRLAKGLTDKGHNVSVLSSVQIRRLTLGEWRFSFFAAHWRRVASELRHFDVVNVHGPIPTMSDIFLRRVSRLPSYSRPAVVYTYHSPIDIRSASRMSARYNAYHQSLALRADRIVASSHYYASQHRNRYGPLVRTIPWGVDVSTSDEFTSSFPAPVRPLTSSQILRILFVGQMRPYKGVETLLAAVAGQDWLELTLVGQGPELSRYQSIARRLSATNTRFLGRLSDAELGMQYQANDVIVLPSVTRAEAFGLVLLEGMASGCVPVASDLPGVRDVAGPTGRIVPPGNAGALRDALRELALDPMRLDELKDASWRAARALTWDRCVSSYEEIFLDAVRSRYAQLHGLAMLPEVDQRVPQTFGTQPVVVEMPANSNGQVQ